MLRIFLSIFLVFCLNASESKKDEPKKTQAPAKSLASVVTHGKVPRRFSSTPAARSKPGPASVVQPIPAAQPQQQQAKKNKSAPARIYIDNQITPKENNLVVNWFDSSNKILEQASVPKGANASLLSPEDASYFYIANNTETLKSNNLRFVNNTVYTLTCGGTAGNSCKQLVVTSAAKQVNRSPAGGAPKKLIAKTATVKGGISLVNNTGKAFALAWLDKNGKQVGTQSLNSNDFVQNIQPVSVKPVKNAIKFQLIRAGSMFSNAINIAPNATYQVTCKPSNFICNQIVITKQAGSASKKKSGNASSSSAASNGLNIYLVNSAKQALTINWLDVNGDTLSSQTVNNNSTQQAIAIPANAINFTIANKEGQIPSESNTIQAEYVYQITCELINNICTAIDVTLQGPVNQFKVTRSQASLSASPGSAATVSKSAGSGVAPMSVSADSSGGASSFSQSDYGTDDTYSTLLPDASSSGSSGSATGSSNGDGSTSGDSSSSTGS